MKENKKRALFLFYRDLRLEDNTSLRKTVEMYDEVIPCFIYSERGFGKNSGNISAEAGKELSALRRQFLLESLQDLDRDLQERGGKLYYAEGDPEKIVRSLASQHSIDAILLNVRCSPGFPQFIEMLKQIAPVQAYHDTELIHPAELLKKDGTPYKVFTPYLRSARTRDVDPPMQLPKKPGVWFTQSVIGMTALPSPQESQSGIFAHGGRTEGLSVLKTIGRPDFVSSYDDIRDIPSRSTSGLSPYLAYGTVSSREAYFAAFTAETNAPGSSSVFTSELIWRDFWFSIAYHFPRVFAGNFQGKYDDLHWVNDEKAFEAWCRGRTGFPIVDAGMRQLTASGYMHNRVRMITASFLTKDLHIDWRWGERFFAEHLLDYDPCVNNGNWQWAASTGCDAQPFFRIFNPWTQQKRFDPDAVYIREWIEELQDIPAKTIHKLNTLNTEAAAGYPAPIVDHAEERKAALALYKAV